MATLRHDRRKLRNISNATDNTYKPQTADEGHTLRAVVTAKNSDGSDSATSVPTAVVPGTPISNNGCPADKSVKTAPIAQLAPPARLQIVSFDVLSGPINKNTNSFTMKVRVGSTCSVNIKGASVYVTAVPYNQFSIPTEELTGDDGTTTLVFHRDANFPASSKQQQLTLFIRATKPGEDPLAGVSTRRPRRRLLQLTLAIVPGRPERTRGAAGHETAPPLAAPIVVLCEGAAWGLPAPPHRNDSYLPRWFSSSPPPRCRSSGRSMRRGR